MKLISNEEDYGKTLIEQWLTAFYTGRNVEKLAPDGVLYRFHLSHNDLDGLACHVVSTIYDCILNCFEIPTVMVDATEALQYKDWDRIHNAHNRMPIRHSICEAGAKNVKEKLHQIFEACCRSVYHKPVGPNDQIILLITDLGGLNDSMFDEFYEKFGDRFQVIVVDHHLTTTVPELGKCDPNQIFWYVTGYKEDNLQSATKNLFTATYDPYDSVHASSIASYFASEKYKTFMKQLTEYVEAVSMYDTGRWGKWLDWNVPNVVDLSVQHQLYFNHLAWDTANVFHYTLISSYVDDIIHLLCTEDYINTNLQYWEIVSGNLNKLHKEYTDMRSMVLVYKPFVILKMVSHTDGIYNPVTRHDIRLGDISIDIPLTNHHDHPRITFGLIELTKDRRQTRPWKYFSLCSRELMERYKLDLLILVDEPNGTVSLRSMDNHGYEINCAEIASRNGGGGHKRAAGYPIPKVVEMSEDHPERYSQFPGVIPYSVTMQKRTETLLYKEADVDIEEDEDDTDTDDREDETEEAEENDTEEAEADDARDADSEEEDSDDEELIPIVDRNRVIRWAGINWKPLQQDDDLLFLTPCEPVDDVKLCTFRELGDVAAEWGAKHLSKTNQSMLVPIYPYGITCTIAPISLEHILNIPDASARHVSRAQISMPYGNVPYWTGSSVYNGGNADDMVWCINEKGQNVPVNKDAFLAFRPMICLHITNALVNSLDDGKSTVLMPNIPNAYPSIGKHVYWAGNDWIVTHVDQKMVYMTLADIVPDWKVAWDELQDTCYAWAKKTFSAEELKKLVPVACGNTHGKVWVASKQLIGTGLAYFADNEHLAVNSPYWTSTERHSHDAWVVSSGGVLYYSIGNKTTKYGFRPSICMPRSNFGPVHSVDDRSEEVELYNSCRTLIATGMRVMWANQEWIVSDIKPHIITLTLAHAAPNPIDWNDLQDACNAWGNQYLAEKKQQLVYLTVGELCGKVFVATKLNMDGGFDYFKDDDRRYLGECYWTSTKDANGRTYYVDKTGKIQSVSGQETSSDTAPKFAFRPTVSIWTEEFCNDRGVTVVSE